MTKQLISWRKFPAVLAWVKSGWVEGRFFSQRMGCVKMKSETIFSYRPVEMFTTLGLQMMLR
jgi:hypothetical protein